jgi:hypothetical protein
VGDTGKVLLYVLGAIVVAGILYWQYKAHQRKVAEFRAFAAKHGWQYLDRGDAKLENRFLEEPFGVGHDRQARHVFRGEHRDRKILAYEYSYKTYSTDGEGRRRSETHTFTLTSVYLPKPKPVLEIAREGLGRKLLGFVGVRDLQLESEQFNDAYRIKTDNDRFAYDILHPRMMEWMLEDSRAQRYGFRFERGDLMLWDDGKLRLDDMMARLDYLCDVLERVPSYVWK